MFNRKSFLTLAFATLGLYYASDAFATCVKVLGADGRLLGCALVEPYPPEIKTCSCSTATTSVQTNLAHHEVLLRVGASEPLDFSIGQERSNGAWTVIPGQAGGDNAIAEFTMTDQLLEGWDIGPDLDGGPVVEDKTQCLDSSGEWTGGLNEPGVLDCEASWVSLGAGQADYSIRYEIPVETSTYSDSDKGHGQDKRLSCSPRDDDNPKGGGKGGGGGSNCQLNQVCTESPNSTEDRPKSLVTYKVFAQEEIPPAGRGVGKVQWRTDNEGLPARFTNCTEFLIDGDNPIDGDDPGEEPDPPVLNLTDTSNNVCILRVGGFPMTLDQRTGLEVVDPEKVAAIFPATDVDGDPNKHLATGQVMFLQQEWLGECPVDGGWEPPTAGQFAKSGECAEDQPLCDQVAAGEDITLNLFPRVVQNYNRECTADLGGGKPGTGTGGTEVPPDIFVWPSLGGPADHDDRLGDGNFGDGFDNGDRVCFPHITVAGVEEPTSLKADSITEIQEAMTAAPPSQVVNLKCDFGSDSGVVKVQICGTDDLNVQEDVDLSSIVLEGGQQAFEVEILPDGALIGPCYDGDGNTQLPDISAKTLSCTAEEIGMAQVIWEKDRAGECTQEDGTPAGPNEVQDHGTCPVGLFAQRNPTAGLAPTKLTDVMNVEVNNVKEIPTIVNP
jgi:hypothetical protein